MNAKSLTSRQLLGGQGINLIERIVTEMGFVWRPTSTHDVGIDGEIEVRNPSSGKMAGFLIKVQSKAVSDFPNDRESSFSYYCDQADLDYWQAVNVPVLLIVSKPATGEAYWLSVRDHLQSQPRGMRKFQFSKTGDRFDCEARDQLARLVDRSCAAFYEPALRISEVLTTNLLKVTRLPPRLFLAPTEYRDPALLIKEFIRRDIRFGREWLLKNGMLLSPHNLSEHPFNLVCDAGGSDHFDVKEWSETDDEDKKRDFVHLLNRCLRERMHQLGFAYIVDKPFECFLCRPPPGSTKREFGYTAEKRRTSRKMVSAVRRKDGSIRYFKHHAFKGHFHRFDQRWFLEVTPTYYFTEDGRKLYPLYEDRLRWLKEQENNSAVRGQLMTWTRLLTAKPDLVATEYPFLGFEEPPSFTLPVGIDDAAWLRLSEASSAAENADEPQLGLQLR